MNMLILHCFAMCLDLLVKIGSLEEGASYRFCRYFKQFCETRLYKTPSPILHCISQLSENKAGPGH